MKRMKWTIQHYISFLRRQHVRVQQIHSLLLAGVITVLLAIIVLYSQYGFFHTRYDRNKIIAEEKITSETPQKLESPSEMLSNLFKEGQVRFSNIGSSTFNFFDNKEVYIK